MDVNITDSRISFNQGDGVNITVTGGNRNVSHSSISSNHGFGFAIWLNDSSSTEYVYFNQSTVIEYSQIFRNKDIGVLVSANIEYIYECFMRLYIYILFHFVYLDTYDKSTLFFFFFYNRSAIPPGIRI